MPCFYCAGAHGSQRRVFGRKASCVRPVETVRRDIVQLQPYVSTFMFDFDWPDYSTLDYYRALWAGLDLKSHFVRFCLWGVPHRETVDLVAQTFKFVYFDLDLCSLSERHRLHLSALKVVKPQPRDEQVIAFFDLCEQYSNVAVVISSISGLPFCTPEDIQSGERLFTRLWNEYTCFEGLAWEPLHAQPGASITLDYEEFQMEPSASTYEDYLKHSAINLSRKPYPTGLGLSYPTIRYKDNRLNFMMMRHFAQVSAMHMIDRRRRVRHLMNR